MLKIIAKAALRQYRAKRSRAEHSAPKACVPLTASEKREVDELWDGLWTKRDYGWHEHYKAVNGEFDARYVPKDVLYLDLLPRLSNTALSAAWADKAYYQERFPGVRFPAQPVACIDGLLYDDGLRPIGWEAAWALLVRYETVFVKPSLGTSCGRGAFKLDMRDVDGLDGLKEVLSESGPNCVVQELVQQNEVLASLNESSLNIIRMSSVRLGGEPFLANATIRFGIPGSATDVAFTNGEEILRLIGLDGKGAMRDFFCDQNGYRGGVSEIGVSGGTLAPGFEKAWEMCAGMHRRLHHFGLVGFDVAIDREGEPVAIEANLRYPGVVAYQYANGPFFGERTEEVLGWCRGRNVLG